MVQLAQVFPSLPRLNGWFLLVLDKLHKVGGNKSSLAIQQLPCDIGREEDEDCLQISPQKTNTNGTHKIIRETNSVSERHKMF